MKERLLRILKRIKSFSFYKKKKFYLVLTVLFSLLLLADVAVAIFVPAQAGRMGNMPDFSQMSENFEESEDGETSMSEGFGRGGRGMGMPGSGSDDGEMTMPEGFGDGEMTMPEGFGDGEMTMPEGFGDGEMTMPEGFGDGEMTMPDGMDMSEMTQTNTSFLQKIKTHWLVIFIILILLDGCSIFMLLFLSKKEKKRKLLEETVLFEEEGGRTAVRKPAKKEKHNQFAGLIVLIAMVLMVIVVKILTSQNGEEKPQTEATVYSGAVETGSVSSVLPGTGTLTEEDAAALELPSDVEITKWYVSNGDTVAEGDKVAQVDTVSVMSAIVAVQEKMVALDEELEAHEDEEIDDTITAGADGKVKVIYAQDEVSVVDTMYESGALMRISLDGLMAVSVETEAELSVGDSVAVTLSDETEVSGKVESILNGTAVITLSDEGPDYGEEVSIALEDGTAVGVGELYIHSELKVTGFTGTVSAVKVEVDEEVTSGETLLTLTDTDYTGEYELLLQQRTKLEEQMQKLFQLYTDGYVYADCAGVISGLDVDTVVEEDTETSTEESADAAADADSSVAEETAKASETSYTKQIATVTTMSYKTSGNIPVATVTSNVPTEDTSNDGNQDSGSDESETTPDEGTTTPDEGITTPDEGTTIPDEGTTIPDEGTTTPDDGGSGSGTNTGGAYTNYIGTVTAVEHVNGTVSIELASTMPGSGNKVTLSASQYVYSFASGRYAASTAAEIQINDMLMLVYESGSSTPVFCIRISSSTSSGTEMPGDTTGSMENTDQINGSQQMPSGVTGSANTGSSAAYTEVMNALEEEIENDYSVATTTWLSVTPQDEMEITITVDEMDILSLEEGQEALVTLDAFPGQSFDGTVSQINVSGTNSGGSSKYEAVIRIAREENMLAGMNASVQISLETKENVLIVPEAALIEEESGVYVYTSYDDKTETFGDLVEVTTGVSDGANVEILSGLSEGSEYWYSYLDVVNYTTSYANTGGFSLDSIFGGRGR